MAYVYAHPATFSGKVAIVGPPHSGKSVFMEAIAASLDREAYYIFRACPDGEGAWTWSSPEAAAFRRKGTFTPEVVDWYIHSLRTMRLAPLVLVDLGGRTSPENERILREGGIDTAIILAGDPSAFAEWESFLQVSGVSVLRKIWSNYHGMEDVVEDGNHSVHHLERGDSSVKERPQILDTARVLMDLVGQNPERVGDSLGVDKISIPELARGIGKVEGEKILPGGRVVKSINWEGVDLLEVSRALHNREKSPVVDIDGAAPGWLIAALAHECHPSEVRVNSPSGFIPVGCQKPADSTSGFNLRWLVGPMGSNGWTTVLCEQEDPSIPLDPADLPHWTPPALPFGAKVIISGRLPLWAVASLAMSYHGTAQALAIFQPGVGSTVVWTHSTGIRLGSLIPA